MAYDSRGSYRPPSPNSGLHHTQLPQRASSPGLGQRPMSVYGSPQLSAGQRYQAGVYGAGPSGYQVHSSTHQPTPPPRPRSTIGFNPNHQIPVQYGMTIPYGSPPTGGVMNGKGGGQFQYSIPPGQMHQPMEVDDDDDEYIDYNTGQRKKKPRTPPDMCGVCGAQSTPEWRKGPAGVRSLCNGCGLQAAKRAKERKQYGIPDPVTTDQIYKELETIGAERFKYPQNRLYVLPPRTRERIQETQQRTQAQVDAHLANASKKGRWSSLSSKPASPPEMRTALLNGSGGGAPGGERAAASALVGMARRGSTSSSAGLSPYGSARATLSSPPANIPAHLYPVNAPRRGSDSGLGLPSVSPGAMRPLTRASSPPLSGLPPMRPPSPSPSGQAYYSRPASPGLGRAPMGSPHGQGISLPPMNSLRLHDMGPSRSGGGGGLGRAWSPGPGGGGGGGGARPMSLYAPARPASPSLGGRPSSPVGAGGSRMSLSHLTHPQAGPGAAGVGGGIRRPASPGPGVGLQRPLSRTAGTGWR